VKLNRSSKFLVFHNFIIFYEYYTATTSPTPYYSQKHFALYFQKYLSLYSQKYFSLCQLYTTNKRLPVPKVTYLVELLCLGKMDLRCSRVLFYCDQIRGYHQIRELHKVISKHIALSRPSATSKYQDILSSSSFLSTIKQQTSATQDKLSNNFVKTEHFINSTVAQRLFYYSF